MRISRKVASSSSGTCAWSSRSTCTPSTRATSATACAIADCMRMPRTSSLSSPSVSTSSLSNWLIGNPSQLASTGVRSSRLPSDRITPHGCRAMWRGSPSSRSTRSNRARSRGLSRPRARSSGSSAMALRASRARMCGKALAISSISTGGSPSAGADVADRVPHLVGVHHRDAGDPLTAEPVEDPLVDLGAPGRLDVDVDVGQLGPQRRAEPLHQQVVADRVDPADAEQVVDQRPGPGPAGGDPHPHVADQVDDLGDGEEVGRVAELGDDLELVGEPALDRVISSRSLAPG